MKSLLPKLLGICCVTIAMLVTKVSYAQTLAEKEGIVEGNKYYLLEEYDEARVAYTKVLTESPSSYKANFNLGNTFYQLNDYKKAATHFKKASEVTKDKKEIAGALHNLGNAYMQERNFEKAIEVYKDALRNNPKDNETRYNFVLAKKLLKNQEKQQNSPDLPPPSDYAKKMKAKADLEAEKGAFERARDIMIEAGTKDSTVVHYQTYIDKLSEIVVLDTIKLK